MEKYIYKFSSWSVLVDALNLKDLSAHAVDITISEEDDFYSEVNQKHLKKAIKRLEGE